MSRIPPHDLDSERAVIGACLLAFEACAVAVEILTPADFYSPVHQQAFDAIRILTTAGERVDPVVVAAMMPEPDLAALTTMVNDTPIVSNVGKYAERVLETAKSRSLIYVGSELIDAGYADSSPTDVARRVSEELAESELMRRRANSEIRGFYPDIGTLDSGNDRDEDQPWIAEGLLRRGQRLMVVAKAGLGKSVLLRQLAFCAENGVHPWTGQPTEKPRRALIVELEAGAWDITASMRDQLVAIARCRDVQIGDLNRPALLHRPGGLDLRTPEGLSAVESAIQRVKPEIVCMGPVKYMSLIKPGENYETAALALHSVLNTMLDRYRFALGLEAHFSRGDHGAPGGSERWVDWPDVGFSIHPPEGDVTNRIVTGGTGIEIEVKQFRVPRDGDIFLPMSLIRGADRRLPWSMDDSPDPFKLGRSLFATRFGGLPAGSYVTHAQDEFGDF